MTYHQRAVPPISGNADMSCLEPRWAVTATVLSRSVGRLFRLGFPAVAG